MHRHSRGHYLAIANASEFALDQAEGPMAIFRGRLAGLIALPPGSEYDTVRALIAQSFESRDIEALMYPDDFALAMCKESDLLVADISGAKPTIYYAIGATQVLQKPVLLLSREQINPSDISGIRVLKYDASLPSRIADFLGYWLEDIIARAKVTS